MRVTLFTDTLADVNGVCRFIRNTAEAAVRAGRDLRVITSTRFETPALSNVTNFPPALSWRIPRYEHLEMVLPPIGAILRHAARERPDVVHVSTPGPVGLLGLLAARRCGAPVLGVYHTDFPEYIDRLFDDAAMTWLTRAYMRAFYSRFHRVFTRSDDYSRSLAGLGVRRDRILPLTPGLDTVAFNPSFRNAGVWARLGLAPAGVKVLYVGRVSVEKSLPVLAAVWKMVLARLGPADPPAELVIVGDGPYRPAMERELEGARARFLGFRHGAELSALYASSDLFVFPSETDTLGQVVMESQASGLPVLVSDKGGPREVVAEGRTGFVLPATSPALWADTIVSLVRDGPRRRAMGEAAALSMQGFSIDRSFGNFWETHARALRDRAPGA